MTNISSSKVSKQSGKRALPGIRIPLNVVTGADGKTILPEAQSLTTWNRSTLRVCFSNNVLCGYLLVTTKGYGGTLHM